MSRNSGKGIRAKYHWTNTHRTKSQRVGGAKLRVGQPGDNPPGGQNSGGGGDPCRMTKSQGDNPPDGKTQGHKHLGGITTRTNPQGDKIPMEDNMPRYTIPRDNILGFPQDSSIASSNLILGLCPVFE